MTCKCIQYCWIGKYWLCWTLTICVWRRRVWGCRGRYVGGGWSSRWRRPPWVRPRSTCSCPATYQWVRLHVLSADKYVNVCKIRIQTKQLVHKICSMSCVTYIIVRGASQYITIKIHERIILYNRKNTNMLK